jgi:hypothetical protein
MRRWYVLSRIAVNVGFDSGASLHRHLAHIFGNAPRLGIRRIVHVAVSVGHELIGAGEKGKQFAALFGSHIELLVR